MRPKTPPAIQIRFVDPDGNTTDGPLIVPSKDRPIRQLDDTTWNKDQTVQRFHEFLQNRDTDGLKAAMRALSRNDCWCEALGRLKTGSSPNNELGQALLSFWMTFGAYSIPRALKEDLVHLVDAFRFLLPPYRGHGLTLFRGELESRHRMNIHGISWTSKFEVAKMFADRRVPDEGQGATLKIEATPIMIVAALGQLSDHAQYLREDEYLVDPREIRGKVSIVS